MGVKKLPGGRKLIVKTYVKPRGGRRTLTVVASFIGKKRRRSRRRS
ncbi:MAG TPA: hypothetical protein VFZ89_19045 [Solirubrobacteraceae bacterium]